MKKRCRVPIVALCTLALAATPVLPAWGTDASSGAMTATNQKNVSVGTNMKRINEFTLDGKYLYKSLGNDSDKPTLTLSTSTLQSIVKNQLLPQWSGLAASVFRDQANQLVDLYGYENNGGTMTQSGFDAYFNMSASGNTKYKDEIWSCYSLKSKLGQTYATHAGDPGWDQLTISGVKQVNSLGEARSMIGQALYDCENHKGLDAHEFVDVTENGSERLDELKDHDTTGFANLVTSVNCKGASADFDYVQFGIVFYDFEAVPVAANGLSYIHGKLTAKTDTPPAHNSEITNGQQQDIAHSAVLGNSVTETTSTTISALASAKMSQNIGASVGWKETQSGSDTEVSGNDDGGIDMSTSGWSEETSMGLNWGASWEMAGAAGVEQGHSTSQQVSKASETTIAIPAHAASNIKQETSTTTYTQYYQQPVVLNYKVALFATSGDFYSGGSGGINPGSYDKQSLVIKFDTKEKENASYGCAATDDLYSRVVTNKDVVNYDTSGRTYSTHSTASNWTASKDINWDAVVNYASSHGWGNVGVGGVTTTNYFYETPGNLSVKQEKTSSSVDSTYPLYDLYSVSPTKTDYVLYSKNTLDNKALALEGYDRDGVPFYGFSSNYAQWGDWYLCDENGVVRNTQALTEQDPATYANGVLTPKENKSGDIYLVWKFKSTLPDGTSWPKTGTSASGQDLSLLNTPGNQSAVNNKANPIVHIHVVNSALDAPRVTAQGSYSGFYATPINLNNVITYEVTDKTDKIIDTEVKWESRETPSMGIAVNADTGYVMFTKPGDYNIRPYVINNNGDRVYSDWITISATKHDMRHYDAQAPSGCTTDGWKEHYKAIDCDKYFSDAEGTNQVTFESLIDRAEHDWGDWTDSELPTDTEAGVQQRVCKNDASHVETRPLYAVKFNMNGQQGIAPATQNVASGASATVPVEPKAAGQTFEGWYTDPSCTDNTAYNFGTTVTGNTTLYAKWAPVKFTVATVVVEDALVDDTVTGGKKQAISSVTGASISIAGETNTPVDDEGYTYHYKEAVLNDNVELTVTVPDGYGLKEIQAIPINSDGSMGTPFVPAQGASANTYTFSMKAADVAVVASVGQAKVTYNGNSPVEGATVNNVPAQEMIAYGGTPTKLNATPAPTVATDSGTYTFGGWCTDPECTKPYLKTSPISEDTTLYAKWVQTGYQVTYTLLWGSEGGTDPGFYSESYTVENGGAAYDPTEAIYSYAGKDLRSKYDFEKDATGKLCWFTSDIANPTFADSGTKTYFDFASDANAITGETKLYARAVIRDPNNPLQYTVTYMNGDTQLGEQAVTYNTAIGELADTVTAPTKEGCTLSGWTTQDGAQWNIAYKPVTDNVNLYASWTTDSYAITFDANGHGTAPEEQVVTYGEKVMKPADDPTAAGYEFGGWYADAACTTEYDFDAAVTGKMTLYAKWTAEKRTVTFDANGHGTAPEAQRVDYDGKVTRPANLIADGYTFGGWFVDQACTTEYDFNSAVKDNMILYAKWTEAAPVAVGQQMFRLYNPNSGEHFYTAAADERDYLASVGWNYEGVGWIAPDEGAPVYRLYNPNAGDHHYTANIEERDYLVSVGWNDEGVGWNSAGEDGVALWRQYNPNATTGSHNYTTSTEERDFLIASGWQHEGIGWYGLAAE